jgi:hypothetical protein
MASTPTERYERLRDWLLQLVDVVLANGGPLAAALVQTAAGRRAVVQLDDVALQLQGDMADGHLRVEIDPAPEGAVRHFRANGDALRDILAGRTLLDAAVVDGRVAVQAGLPDLLAVHDLVLRLLAAGPQHRALRTLWAQFDAWWPRGPLACVPLDAQRPQHGRLRDRVPLDVLLVRLDGTAQ